MKRLQIFICLLSFLLLCSCTSEKNMTDQSASETGTVAVDSMDTEQTTSSYTEQPTAGNFPTSEIRSDAASRSNSGYSENNSSGSSDKTESAVGSQSPIVPETSQGITSDPASSSTASKESPPQSDTESQSPSSAESERYLAEDYGMTYSQMEDICRKYVESLGIQYDPTFTTENAGFTGRVTSFGDTWEEFYESICRWTDATVELCSPKSIRVQFIRSEDETFEYAYVLWM